MPKKKGKLPLIPERLAAHLWRQREWRSIRQTLDGRHLSVAYPGRPNKGPGPDFKDAVLQVEGSPPVRGDVEVHRQTAGWRQHGHHLDPRYNSVVLHVVMQAEDGATTFRQDGHAVPAIALAPERCLPDWPEDTFVLSTLPPLRRWRALSREQLKQLMEQSGRRRFHNKSAAFLRTMATEDIDEVVYRGILEALGYSQNRGPMRELARRLPWRTVRDTACATPLPFRMPTVRCLLLAVAGLPGRIPEDAERSVQSLGDVPAADVGPMDPRAWRYAGVRPANQPHRRLAGAAALLAGFLDTGLIGGLLPKAREKGMTPLVQALTAVDEGVTLIGRDRALDMAVNVALPALHAWGTLRGEPAMAEACLALYCKAPRLADNEITREMEELLGLQGAWCARRALEQQGLLHLYQLLLEMGIPSQPEIANTVQEWAGYYSVPFRVT